uniref:Putative secreted protein n=1 Tax=Amblyomma triste TaxID=251400 RepID=A0A023G247_AMBTT
MSFFPRCLRLLWFLCFALFALRPGACRHLRSGGIGGSNGIRFFGAESCGGGRIHNLKEQSCKSLGWNVTSFFARRVIFILPLCPSQFSRPTDKRLLRQGPILYHQQKNCVSQTMFSLH